MPKIKNDLDLIKNEVMDVLTGVTYVENNCTSMVYVRDGQMLLGLRMRGRETYEARGGEHV